MAAYMFFANDKRPEVRKAHPELRLPDVARRLGAMWKELSDEQKAPYQQQAEADKQRSKVGPEPEPAAAEDAAEPAGESEEEAADAAAVDDAAGPAEEPEEEEPEARVAPKPKRAKTAYFAFLESRRAACAAENEGALPTKVTGILAKEWQGLSEAEREPFKKVAAEAKAQRDVAMAEWLKDAPQSALPAKARPDPRKKYARPKTAYLFWCDEEREVLKTENPNLTAAGSAEHSKILGARWKALSDEDKAPYVAKAAEAKVEFASIARAGHGA